ncbi:hypothetical protein [uncultured Pseudomonas sp.]|uniref:hypothetical protein n=1 Tax=uncultured Pseudomonas sp. TaxID=114707 RepID=UPI002591FD80|nr:hypothetical protein [uncultured Pseudomonas sp.]
MRLNRSDFFIRQTICALSFFLMGSTFASQIEVCKSAPALFYCKVSGGKDLAICPSYIDGELAGIQYRFGQEGKKGLVFPGSGFGFKEFKSNHFFRYQVDYKLLKFSVGSYVYSLYSNYDGEDVEGAVRSAGVVVSSLSGSPDVRIPCVKIYVDKLEEVMSHVECDVSDAMGCT